MSKNIFFFLMFYLQSCFLFGQEALQIDSSKKGGIIFFDLGVTYIKHINFLHDENPSYRSFNEYHRQLVKNDRAGGYGWGAALTYLRNNWVVGTEFNKSIYTETYHGEKYETGNYAQKELNTYEYLAFSLNAGKIVLRKKNVLFWWRGGLLVEKKYRIGAFSNNLHGDFQNLDISSELFNYYNPYVLSMQSDVRMYYQIKKVYFFGSLNLGGNVTDVLKKEAPYHNQKLFFLFRVGAMLPMFRF